MSTQRRRPSGAGGALRSTRSIPKHSAAACFSSFALTHLFFVDSFDQRQTIAQICCLGWNIGLFPNASMREEHIDSVYRMGDVESQRPGFESGWKGELRGLVELKRDLFPWMKVTLPKVTLRRGTRHDVLVVGSGATAEERELVTHPRVLGLPFIMEALFKLQRDTAAQVGLVGTTMNARGMLSDVEATAMATAYCVQRADLVGYRRLLSGWHESSFGAAAAQQVIRSGLGVIDAVEADTRAVLATLARE